MSLKLTTGARIARAPLAFDLSALERDLRAALDGEVRFDTTTRLLYSTDASNYQIVPLGVAFPRHTDDVAAAHQIAAQHGVPLLPRGAGSALAGQTVGCALVLDLSRHMRRVLSVHAEAGRVRVQSGMVLGQLNAQLAPLGLMVGPDPASADRATVGGCLGNNATGMHSILYGMFSDHVVGVEAVLADGERLFLGAGAPAHPRADKLRAEVATILNRYTDEIAARYPQTWRTVAGYALNRLDPQAPDLAQLFVGAEGTLGTVTEVDLALVPRPRMTRLALVHYGSLPAALEAAPGLLETGPSAIELLDKMLLDMTRAHPEYSRHLTFVESDPAAVLAVEFYGETVDELAAKIDRLRQKLAAQGHREQVVIAATEARAADVLKVRKAGLGLLMSIRGDFKPVPFIEDAAVPVDHLAAYVAGVERIVAENGARMALYAHASAGCLHIRPLLNLKSAEGLRRYRAIAEATSDLVLTYHGTTSGEHGEGLSRGEFSRKLFGPILTEAFREVKRAFDPQGLMNPGKVVDVGPMDDPRILRYGPDYATPFAPAQTRLDWSHDGGFAGAVEMCNGAGVCRKEGTGTMCPSFMATRDEQDSTRGRANILRLAMTGHLGSEGLTDRRVAEVLDLCLSCKACKAECPSLVDMARLKAEFTAAYYDRHGTPLRARLFGHIHRLNRLGSLIPPLANATLRSAPGRWALARIGVAPERALPTLARQRFSAWVRQQGPVFPPGAAEAPILIADTYTEYNTPRLGQAALRVAQAAGFRVEVWGPRELDCCGRPLISKGLLDGARALAVRNVQRMGPVVARGGRFMLLEPSCAAAFRDEYADLVPAALRGEAEQIAAATLTVEEWLAEIGAEGKLPPERFDAQPREVLLHGHCYERALWGTTATHLALRLIPNCHVTELDDGCCGVAGSFGYEREHYTLSMQIGEQRLLPAVRAAPEAITAASGVSCREQVHHGAGRTALHPVEIVAAALREP